MKISRRGVVSTLGAIVVGVFGGKCKAQVIDEEPFMVVLNLPEGCGVEEAKCLESDWSRLLAKYPRLKNVPVVYTYGGVSITVVGKNGSCEGDD